MKTPRHAFFTASVASLALALLIFLLGLRQVPSAKVWQGAPQFNSKNAYRLTDSLARGFPNRVPWRPERKGAADFLKKELSNLGFEVSSIPFEEVIAGKKITGLENIYAILKGVELPDEYIVVNAHYDITDTTIEGATDDASGVGTVLELARIFKQGPAPRRSIVFLLDDSEEFGAFWGAHIFVSKFPYNKQIVADVSLDFVAPDDQEEVMVLSDGLRSGYAPLWLREMSLDAIRQSPFKAGETQNIVEFVQRAILIPPSDHGAFLMAGIPAINLFGRSSDFANEMGQIHHTPADNMSHLKIESFTPYGRSAEILIRSIDAIPNKLLSQEFRESNYWKLSNNLYLTGYAVSLICFLLFAPFLSYVSILVYEIKGQRSKIFSVARNEAKGFAILLGSFIVGYVFLRMLPELDLITKYEMFPATQKSSLLYKPAYTAIFFIIGTVIGLYFVLARVFESREDTRPDCLGDRTIRHALLGIILASLIGLAFVKNTYLATLLLLPPAYLWTFMKKNRRFESRLLNSLLFLGGLVSFIAICIAMTMVFHVGIFYWYLFLAISYGLISIYAAIIASAVIAVGIRILRNLVL